MDLTNIKPCVECKWVEECERNATMLYCFSAYCCLKFMEKNKEGK